MTLLAFLFISASFIVASAFLLTHEFESINNSSILKYLVDKEIRGLPIISEGSNITYKSYPVDGTSKGFDAVRLNVKDKDRSYKQVVDYFIALGYIQDNNHDLLRNGDKMTIEQAGNSIEVTKYSWD